MTACDRYYVEALYRKVVVELSEAAWRREEDAETIPAGASNRSPGKDWYLRPTKTELSGSG